MKPGKPKRVDYEYKRHGTQNLFMFLLHFKGGAMLGSDRGAGRSILRRR